MSKAVKVTPRISRCLKSLIGICRDTTVLWSKLLSNVHTFVKRPYLKIFDHFYGIHAQTSINAQILQKMEKDDTQLQLVADRVDLFLSTLNTRHRLVAILYFHLRKGADKMSGDDIRKKLRPTVSKQRISAMVQTIKRLFGNDTIENGPICGLRWYDPEK